ncbi:hypothetical protein CGLO_00420 [Colletotrichum gloeosporioides Cg-14]|uniref:Uncharacterized protein n=1 Tax=Colletotrichum gloeosporioides (strain Cg-14) TaxID=1237896 RepID=T0L368_COLGC|nr:hypothetical protein CGLO_00420 [Colletotrichum gloeosporioides Cg-14]
MLLLVCLF